MKENKTLCITRNPRDNIFLSTLRYCIFWVLLLTAFYLNYNYCGNSGMMQLIIFILVICYFVRSVSKKLTYVKTKEEAIAIVNKFFEEK